MVVRGALYKVYVPENVYDKTLTQRKTIFPASFFNDWKYQFGIFGQVVDLGDTKKFYLCIFAYASADHLG